MTSYRVRFSLIDDCYHIGEDETGNQCSYTGDLKDIGATYHEAEEIHRGYGIILENPAIDYIHGIFHSQIDED